jgi:hypothetical protein
MDSVQPAEGVVTVRGDADGFAQEIAAGAHRLRSDEPASAGGTDSGPTPYDLLLAALGSQRHLLVYEPMFVDVRRRDGTLSPFRSS